MNGQPKAGRNFRMVICLLVLMAGIAAPSPQPARAQARTFDTASEGFAYQWEYSDRAVAAGRVARTWLWGPAPLGPARPERMVGSPARGATPADSHLVQYFDKARMEFAPSPGGLTGKVTNGRLVVEMMSGGIQTSLTGGEFFPLLPYSLAIAGDTQVGDAHTATPTYASLFTIANIGGNGPQATPRPVGTRITATYARSGAIGTLPANAVASARIPTVGTFYPAGDPNGHNLPDVFVEFLTQQGPVASGPTTYRTDYLFEGNHWALAVGLPITEPYWAQVRISGRDSWVMFQAFERRVLTYNPSTADPLWRVEMGNVGQHYKDWRPEPLVASPLQGVRVVQSSPNPTSDVCFGGGAIGGFCPTGELGSVPRDFLTTLRSENSWARTKPNGWMLLHSDNAIYDMQSSAMLMFKRIDNSVDSVQQQGGHIDYLHAPKRRIEVDTGTGAVDTYGTVHTYGTLFSIIILNPVQAGDEQLRIVVPSQGGSVTLQPPSPGLGLPSPAPIVVQSRQVLIVSPNGPVIRPTTPEEETYWAEKLDRLQGIPEVKELAEQSKESGGPADTPVPPLSTATPASIPTQTPPPTATSTPVPTQTPGGSTATPVPTATPTSIPTQTPPPTATSTPVPTQTPGGPKATSVPPSSTATPTTTAVTSTPTPPQTQGGGGGGGGGGRWRSQQVY